MTSFEQLVEGSIRGVAQVIKTDRGFTFSRLPAWTFAQHAHEPNVAKMAERTSGVHLNIQTSATEITVVYRTVRDRDLSSGWEAGPSTVSVTCGDDVQSVSHTDGDMRVWKDMALFETIEGVDSIAQFTMPASDEPRLVQIWLPHNCPTELISIDANAPLLPGPAADRLWVHYGSSISHCEDAAAPVEVWPVAAARALGVDIYNMGLSGCANLEQFAARAIREIPADVISLKLGINVVNGAHMTARTFGPAVHGFLDTIREAQPTTPILVISPVCCPAHENNPGPSELGPDGKVGGQEFSRHDWIGELTLTRIRSILESIVEQRSVSDNNLYYLDGLKLFNQQDALTMPDGIHPDAAGYRVIAQKFIANHPDEWLEPRH